MVAAHQDDPSLTNDTLSSRFFYSAKVSATLSDGETSFWAVNYGHRIGIYRAWCVTHSRIDVAHFLNETDYSGEVLNKRRSRLMVDQFKIAGSSKPFVVHLFL